MKKLTRAEKQWLSELQDVFNRCPSKRFSAFTTGADQSFTIYDSSYDKKIIEIMDRSSKDQCIIVSELDCEIATIDMPFDIQSTAG